MNIINVFFYTLVKGSRQPRQFFSINVTWFNLLLINNHHIKDMNFALVKVNKYKIKFLSDLSKVINKSTGECSEACSLIVRFQSFFWGNTGSWDGKDGVKQQVVIW